MRRETDPAALADEAGRRAGWFEWTANVLEHLGSFGRPAVRLLDLAMECRRRATDLRREERDLRTDFRQSGVTRWPAS